MMRFKKVNLNKIYRTEDIMNDYKYLIRSASIDITNKCNFRCLHCYNYSGEHQREREMNDDELLKIFEEIARLNPDSICICGGEPLLRINLVYRICDLVKKINSNISINMVSNGYFMNQDIAANLKKKGLNSIQFSLDGLTEYTHNWLRNNREAYGHVINAIKIALDEKLIVHLACCPTKKNFNEIKDIIGFCQNLGIGLLRFQPLMVMGRGTVLKDYALTDEEYMNLARLLKEKNNKKMAIEWGDPLEHLTNIAFTNKIDSYIDLGISAYGDITVSPYLPIIIGNIRKRSLMEYLEVGIQNIYLDSFIKKCAVLMTDWNKMNLHMQYEIFPRVGIDRNINYDLLDKANNDIDIVQQVMELK